MGTVYSVAHVAGLPLAVQKKKNQALMEGQKAAVESIAQHGEAGELPQDDFQEPEHVQRVMMRMMTPKMAWHQLGSGHCRKSPVSLLNEGWC